jgi:DNA repair protein RadD
MRDDNPCVVIPTGGGKTPVMSTICEDAVNRWGGRVIILAHVKELLDQTAGTLRRMAPDLDIGVYSAGLRSRDTDNQVVVAGIQSVYKRACELDGFDLAIIDEAHMIPLDGEGMYQSFLKDAMAIRPHMRVVGLTATPYRMKEGLICQPDHFLNHVCYEIKVGKLIQDGYLSKLKSKAAKSEVDTSELHVRGGEFISWEMENLMDQSELVRKACEEIIAWTDDRRSALVFCVGVRHAHHVAETLRELTDEPCETITGDTPPLQRAAIIDRFRCGDLKYLTNVNVLTTGFDAPNIDAICLLRPTYSPGLYYQMVGRGFRLCDGKDHCLVLDFAGNIRRHGPVDAVTPPDGSGNGPEPVKVCPNCQEVVNIGVRFCPECEYEFEMSEQAKAGERKHYAKASTDAILSSDLPTPTDTEYEVTDVAYSVHVKRDAPEGHPRTLRVDYQVGWNQWQSEWVCVEHTGYARAKAEAWWRRRSLSPAPRSAEIAVACGEAGGLAKPLKITVRSVPGERYDRIVDYELGPVPEAPLDEHDETELPEYEWPEDDIPF